MQDRGGEWRTVGLVLGCYGVWLTAIGPVATAWFPAGMALAGLAGALHSSLQHEAIHGHPFRDRRLNAALVFPALTLAVPYARFRDLHLAHHRDADLTDPYDDPESNYFDPARWDRLPRLARAVLRANNTLGGRVALGPAIGQALFMRDEWRRARAGDARVLSGWLWHVAALGVVVAAHAAFGAMPVWAVLASAYLGLSLIKVRTFAEHRAHEHFAGRTVVIEDRGALAFLFLNNNLHVVHHMHPSVPWYRLPELYARDKARFLGRNGGYRFASYGALFRRYLWRPKDPVPHPFYRGG